MLILACEEPGVDQRLENESICLVSSKCNDASCGVGVVWAGGTTCGGINSEVVMDAGANCCFAACCDD